MNNLSLRLTIGAICELMLLLLLDELTILYDISLRVLLDDLHLHILMWQARLSMYGIVHHIVLNRVKIARLRLVAVDQDMLLMVRHIPSMSRQTAAAGWLAGERVRARGRNWKCENKNGVYVWRKELHKINVEMSRENWERK